MRFSAGETTLRFGRAVAFFAAGILRPCNDVFYSISIRVWKTLVYLIANKGGRVSDELEEEWIHCMEGRKMEAESIGPNLTVGGGEKRRLGSQSNIAPGYAPTRFWNMFDSPVRAKLVPHRPRQCDL